MALPVLLESFAIRANSGGNGCHRGGNGVVRRVRFLEDMTAGILSGRRGISPCGLHGGEAGKVGRNYVERVMEMLRSWGVRRVWKCDRGMCLSLRLRAAEVMVFLASFTVDSLHLLVSFVDLLLVGKYNCSVDTLGCPHIA